MTARTTVATFVSVLALTVALLPAPAEASDHADPITLTQLAAGITGLFAFPDPETGENLIVILTIRRGLTGPQPYPVEGYVYSVHFDLDSFVDFTNKEHLARYGGNVLSPEGISEDASIHYRLDSAGKIIGSPHLEGALASKGGIQFASGVYDDPFIFPRFFGKNVIAMAASIPFAAFPERQQDYLIWGSTTKDGKKIDHVGRSNRTQLGRFDFLNRLHPSEHVRRIQRRGGFGDKLQEGLTHLMGHFLPVGAVSGLFEYVLQIRPYDAHPDVMIFTRRADVAPGFPNGRRLPDDVAGLTCAQGDCVLQEVAFIEGGWPRQTTNDKPFSPSFPYLAPPHPEKPQHDDIDRCAVIFWLIVLALLILWIWRKRKKTADDEVPRVRPRHEVPS